MNSQAISSALNESDTPFSWLPVAALSVGYFVLAEAAMAVATPPVYAAPVWPAAGLALVGLLTWGRRYWPALWLGAFSSDLLHKVVVADGELSASIVALTAITAVGSVLQALLGARWLQPLVQQIYTVGTWSRVLKLLLAGPVACVLAASVGVATMHLFEGVPVGLLASSWLTWWAADSLGVLLVLPLILPSLNLVRGPLKFYVWKPLLLPVVVLILILAGFFLLTRAEQTEHKFQASSIGDVLHEHLDFKLILQSETTRALADFISVRPNIDLTEFNRFTQRSLAAGAIQGLAWIPRVSREQRLILEASKQADGLADFVIREADSLGRFTAAAERDAYYPLSLVAASINPFPALGYDLGSEANSLLAMQRAMEQARPMLAARHGFYSGDAERRDDFRLFVPIYRSGFDPAIADPESRRNAVTGFAGALIYFQDLVVQLKNYAANAGFALRFSLMLDNADTVVLVDTRASNQGDGVADWVTLEHYPERMSNGQFKLELWPQRPWQPGQSLMMKVLIVAAVLVMLLVTAFVIYDGGQNARIERKVKSRTEALRKAERAAINASQAKSEFLATMSHEIRTPLNGVVGMVDVMSQTNLQDNQIQMLDLIRLSAFSLLDVISDILDFSKIEAGKLEIESSRFDLAAVVTQACDLQMPFARQKGCDVSLSIDPALPQQVNGDAVRLRQVLINLLNNAIKFSSQQSAAKVSVSVTEDSRQSTSVWVNIEVTDNGIGIAKELQPKLFEAFSQADASTTRRFGGSGLGLAISHHLVSLMGGEIDLQSESGQGATFSVRLPFQYFNADIESVAELAPIEVKGCLIVGHSTTGLAGILATRLARESSQVQSAADIQAAATMTPPFPPGPCLWVHETSGTDAGIAELRAAARCWQHHQVRFITIEQGNRHRPRQMAVDHLVIDADAFKREDFLDNVAEVAGQTILRLDPESVLKATSGFIRPKPAAGQGALILVAEDNLINQKVIGQQLELLGHRVDIVGDGLQALNKWRTEDYALLITDLHMPKMDGYQLTAAIRAEQQQSNALPIIALTANALKAERERCLELGMDDYLIKPVQLEVLQARLDQRLLAGRYKSSASETTTDAAKANAAKQKKAVDTGVLKQLVGDDVDVINKLLHDYLQDVKAKAVKITDAGDKGDIETIANVCHSLKSSSRSVGALVLGDVCAELERAGKAGDTMALTRQLLLFERELQLVVDYLQALESPD